MTTLGPIGLASGYPYTDDSTVVADEARHAESLGFSTLWRSGNLTMVDAAVRATDAILVATGIIPVSVVPAADVIATYTALALMNEDPPGVQVSASSPYKDIKALAEAMGLKLDIRNGG